MANDPIKGKMRRFRTILEEDYNFDAIKELVDLYRKVCRSRIKRQQKYKMQFDMLTQIIAYSYPKLKSEETKGNTGDKIFFNIQVGAPEERPGLPGNTSNKAIPATPATPAQIAQNTNVLEIPTKIDKDGAYVVSMDDVK